MTEPLSVATVGAYLVGRGIVGAGDDLDARELGGGVSSVVLDVRTPERRFVVKQPLDAFLVPDEWIVKRERALVEASALNLAARVMVGAVPEVIDVDRERLVLTMERAPEGWRPWKESLLEGDADQRVAERLGSLLRAWHDATRGANVLARFDDPEIFEQQRADPYYRTTMQRRPEIADAIGALLGRMLATKTCLVHGDWSPKNVLVGEDGMWVIDWEIAHAGDPAFDLAFMTNHLMLKAIHGPGSRADYERCAGAFWRSYGDVPDASYVLAHTGCLMVARVDGKSPAEYLDGSQRRVARRVGSGLVLEPAGSVEEAWAELPVV